MKKVFVVIILISIAVLNILLCGNANFKIIDLPLADEYSNKNEFGISKLPSDMFYRLNYDCKYILDNGDEIAIRSDDNYICSITYNNVVLDLFDDVGDWGPCIDASMYFFKENRKYYLLVDKMHFNDTRYYSVYSLSNNKIELVEEENGRIDFVGYDYIIGYTDLGMIGYQRCEFKKVFKNGKFELDGEYKVVGNEDYPIWKFYSLTKDLKYNEYDENKKKYSEVLLKQGTMVRAISTDRKNYIVLETTNGKTGKVKVDRIDEEHDGNFIVNGEVFMNYYFLDGSKYDYEVFSSMPAY